MNRLSDRFARHDETGRATELDPSTFDCPCEQYPCAGELAPAEETQPHPTGIDWFVIAVWSALFGLSGLAWWGIVETAQWLWEMM